MDGPIKDYIEWGNSDLEKFFIVAILWLQAPNPEMWVDNMD